MNQNQSVLLKNVTEAGFMVDEIVLYLDTHPSCEKGLKYYHEAIKKYHEAKREYEEHCGPLTKSRSHCPDYFDWVNNPWPWEGGCN